MKYKLYFKQQNIIYNSVFQSVHSSVVCKNSLMVYFILFKVYSILSYLQNPFFFLFQTPKHINTNFNRKFCQWKGSKADLSGQNRCFPWNEIFLVGRRFWLVEWIWGGGQQLDAGVTTFHITTHPRNSAIFIWKKS